MSSVGGLLPEKIRVVIGSPNNATNCYLHGGEVVGSGGLTGDEACCACGGGITSRKEADVKQGFPIPPKSMGRKVGGPNSGSVAAIG
mmetsp:Transcript_11151/g.14080  ORF Transcript_11151/g.14080 Transcript_11151/m.14080 type:complete len:87 (-) Transcript_11151:46-306(-)|eukprot:CAMPEP_0203642652 /NCGR_PEP_ID=MMETSP0088-20131115/8038_1 /ASSEMBLY_ACC=CAM_ASM_001087 /TAXON_ID=426623 /ORGANISM="Chaetoceros affinis, Strain CCMP159" /LENGTH=86 /DNA_ID=CAMNT_0050498543 /DNA_START=68 /DNA_END=328 /DNA_ORIENTATION=-